MRRGRALASSVAGSRFEGVTGGKAALVRDAGPGAFLVRARVGLKVLGFTLVAAVFGAVGIGLVADAVTDPSHSVGGRLLLGGFGLLVVLLFIGGAIAMLGQALSRLPVLELHERGVVLPVAWPYPRSKDKALPWEEVASLCVYTQRVRHRGGVSRIHYLAFVPVAEVAEERPASRFESFAAGLAGAPSGEAVRYSLHLRPGLSATVEQIVEEARRRKPDLEIVDRRDLSWLQRRAKRRQERERGVTAAP
jgi:hypothetical protein